ncbi:hypothetical protein SAMN04487965_3688 [Microbulbifer donghaiensis]|uniref:N-acetyltransferase domain-containing protein n=1 Tax=Microbulbifer donghaiensis TaxID=494016 RepID=A0A1M5IJP4_9GAMM|nr:hypothetical protein [Microbulbifer donghaiensis]SHG28485.1 hypothetical protein SAMN04487965_3688 [Microbulbifer donghaiensis]
MLATHIDAEMRYEHIREMVLAATQKYLKSDHPNLILTTINQSVLRAVDSWSGHPERQVNWNWAGSYPDLKFRYPKRFECAVWNKGQLNALSFGRPTYNCGSLRLDFIEASPEDREIAVFDIIIVAMRTYADMLGAKELRIMNPINGRVKEYYEYHGFVYVRDGDYLFRRV